ncbi:hypothetical protein D7B24_008033 [Verticillium nonalfalfae]|uniref:Uncharacterized protein n=1 Tax=Verticillium nonalfalfae TaxID=1051616 RepID=A0A3M9Y6A5_9PEZI|nr:uncharacterized protein D7B24_008033 [Verticillium nonalfalfae]RNJ55834.1 hypothetical protein D7B24_008033 [Verticillium nonalfalfae]
MSASAITIAAAPRPWSLKAAVNRFRSSETKYQAYVPTHARTDFLRTATPRHMRKANEIL